MAISIIPVDVGNISLKEKQFFKLSIIPSVSPWQSYEREQPFLRTAVHAVAEDGSVALSFLNTSLTTGVDSDVGSRGSWCMDLPNNADIVL